MGISMNSGINYSEDLFKLYSHHDFNTSDEDIDFHIEVDSLVYWGSAFTMNSIKKIMHRKLLLDGKDSGGYFWAANFIILKEFTLDCLVNSIRHLVITGDYKEAFYPSDAD